MKAFHGSEEIKADLIQRLQFHYDHDNLVKGQYWEDGKGCAIGCALSRDVPDGSWRSSYTIQFGIPEVLATLQDRIFESLPNEKAKEWPLQFTKAINVGSDLSRVWPSFSIWLLIGEEEAYDANNAAHADAYAYADADADADADAEKHYIAQSKKLIQLLEEAK